jgi:hypothetical protein
MDNNINKTSKTSKKEIADKLEQLQSIIQMAVMMIGALKNLKTKLKLDLSSNCSELGKYAGFIIDCRDKFLDAKINDLALLVANVSNMYNGIDQSN